MRWVSGKSHVQGDNSSGNVNRHFMIEEKRSKATKKAKQREKAMH